jgi:uncharacterized RDD family membrane protein YckC
MGGAPAVGGPAVSQWGNLASWGERVVAYLIDWVIIFVPGILLFIIAVIMLQIATILGVLFYLVFLAYAIGAGFYVSGYQNGLGASPGKKVTGLRVISEETGQPIGGGMGIARQVCHILDGFCLIGYLFPLWDPKRQTFADKIIKTVVTTGNAKVDFATAVKSLIPNQS